MPSIDRRNFMMTSTVVAGGAALASGASISAQASEANLGSLMQPGYYRTKVGDIEITVLSDGIVEFPPETLFPGHVNQAKDVLAASFRPPSPVGLQLNTTLIKTAGRLILVDAGCGANSKVQPTAGKQMANLGAAGFSPADIDIILITHGHFDHLWGISDLQNQRLLFPKAEFIASEAEVKFWNSPDGMRVDPKQRPEVTVANLNLAGPRMTLIKAGKEIAPGVTTIDTPGHTPGHMSLLIHSGKEQLLLTADVVVEYPVNFLYPDWPFGFDYDRMQGQKSRAAFLDRAAVDRTLVGGYHLPFPGFGHVVRQGSGYGWVPADWQWTA